MKWLILFAILWFIVFVISISDGPPPDQIAGAGRPF